MSTSEPLHLLERGQVFNALHDILESSRDGEGSLVLITGDAGIGKTSVVNEFVRTAAARGFSTVRGACDPFSTPRPFGPLKDMSDDPASPLADVLSGRLDKVEIFELMLRRVRESTKPLVLVFEDLHWADEATVEMLQFVGRRLMDTATMVVGTYRSSEVPGHDPLRTVLGELAASPNVHRVELTALSAQSVASLATGSDLDPHVLHTLTEGNPFYVTEIIQSGETLPTSIRDAVVGRVSRFDANVQRLIELVSLGPRSMEYDLLDSIADVSPTAVDAAVAGGILILDGAALRFRHHLARAAVEASITPTRRLELHLAIVQQLNAAPRPDLARIAHHAAASGKHDVINEALPLAARDALRRGSFAQAVVLFERAIESAKTTRPDLAIALQSELIAPLHSVSRLDDALLLAEKVLIDLLPSQHLPRAKTLTLYSRLLISVPKPALSRQALDEALSLLRPLGPSVELWEAVHLSSLIHMLHRQRDAAGRDLLECEDLLRDLVDQTLTQRTAAQRATIEMAVGDAFKAKDLLQGFVSRSRASGQSLILEHYLGMLGTGAGERRLYAAATPALDEVITLSERMGRSNAAGYHRSWRARIAFELGRWSEVEGDVQAALESAHPGSSTSMTAHGALGRTMVRRGDSAGAQLLQQIFDNYAASHLLQYVWSPACGLAEHLWFNDEVEAMRDIIEPVFARALACDSEWARGEVGFWAWRCGLINTPPDNSALPYALQISGRWQEAADAWREIGCPFEQAMALGDGATDSLHAGLAIVNRLGSTPAVAMFEQRLEAAKSDSSTNPAGLTRRQLEVLDLVAKGLDNATIATELFVSKKTVEHHVSAIFTKLGVTSRTAAVAEGHKRGAVDLQ